MTRAEKEEFKRRMARGRAKAKRARKHNPLTGIPSRDIPRLMKEGKSQKQAEAIALAEQRRRAKNPSARKTKKKIGKAFGKQLAAEHVREKKKAAKAKKTARKMPHKKNSRRRNQEPGSLEAAEQQYERFHGKPPGKIVEYDMQYRYPEHFAELGRLVELRFFLDEQNPDFRLTRFGTCQVVSTPDGSNIYFIGGDQSVDLQALDISSDKDRVELGPCMYISYHTIKGFHDFEPTTYWHEFGEEDGIVPQLVYDRLNKTLFLNSGNYRVRPEGIVN